MSKATQVILVDKNDNPIGTAEKLLAHQKNLCHRAFSVILTREINNNIEILLQKRQKTKYHCANLWSNTCCSHPKPGENTLESAKKRLLFEMGITCKINYIGAIYYQTKLANQLFEHEYDHVFHGNYTEDHCDFNEDEVATTQWIDLLSLKTELKNQPHKFTPWLNLAIKKLNLKQS